jgi:8-oxo-dGTP diphosphatase
MLCADQPKVGVGVLLVDESGRLLLTLRRRPPEAGCWSIVGGKLDYLETLEQCAVREALEEVGAAISIDSLLCVTDHLVPAESQHWSRPLSWRASRAATQKTASPTKRKKSAGSLSTHFPPI